MGARLIRTIANSQVHVCCCSRATSQLEVAETAGVGFMF